MSTAKHIGRVGALAVALGMGTAIASTPGVALADPADSGTSSSSDSRSSSRSSPESGSATSDTSSSGSSTPAHDAPARHRKPLNRPGEMAVSSSGGLTSSTTEPSPSGSAASVSPGEEVRRTHSGAPGAVVVTGSESTTDTSTTRNANAPRAFRIESGAGLIAKAAPGSGSAAAAATRTSAWLTAATTAGGSSLIPGRVVADVVQPSTLTTPTVATSVPDSAAAVQEPADPGNAVRTPTPADIVSTLVSAVLSPLANSTPNAPAQPPTLWTLLAFVRREFEQAFSKESPTVNRLAGQFTNGLVTDTPTLDDQSIYPAITGGTGALLADVSDMTSLAQLNATAAPATFTGEPSIVSQVLTGVFRVVRAVGDFLGVDLTIPLAQLLSSDSPPWFTTLGLNVQRSEFEGMPVWALQSPESTSDETVVAIHGGAFVAHVGIFNWLNYAAMARDTGATVIVPIYPLVPQGGTAGTVVPAMADLISSQIDQRGAENVSVYGDSAGGYLALAAVQELVRRGDPVPSHMVLISPPLDLTLSNPAIQFVDDPLFSGLLPTLHNIVQQWAGDLDLTDPLVSPLYGSLAGLPPTAVYFGSLEIFAPDGLVLQDKALATPGADFTFILRKGELHDWATVPILPETLAVLPDIYQQLGIAT
jgi:triacylglycerol lipase